MADNIDFPNIFRATFVDKKGETNVFTAFLISSDGYLLTVAHPFYENFEAETIVVCENLTRQYETTLVFVSKDKNLDFAFLKIIKPDRNLPKPLFLQKYKVSDNLEIYGYGFGIPKNEGVSEMDIFRLKIGGNISIDFSFSKNDNYRQVIEGDSGAPLFPVNSRFVIGINNQKTYTPVENQEYFAGYLLSVIDILKYLKQIDFKIFDFEKLCKEYYEISQLSTVNNFAAKGYEKYIKNDLLFFHENEISKLNKFCRIIFAEKIGLMLGNPASGKTILTIKIAEIFEKMGLQTYYYSFKKEKLNIIEEIIIQNRDKEILFIIDDIHLNIEVATNIFEKFQTENNARILFISRNIAKNLQKATGVDYLNVYEKIKNL